MIGAERGDSARKVAKLLADIEWAEAAGLDSAWIPQVPNDFDALTAVALMATRTSRIELGTAVVPLQAQHPIALARQALSVHAAAGGRLALGVGPSHHWIIRDMLGLPYERPAAFTRDYLDVLAAAFGGPGRSTSKTTPSLSITRWTWPGGAAVGARGRARTCDAGPGRRARRRDGVVDGRRARLRRACGPAHNQGRRQRGRPAPRIVAGIPVCLCAASQVDAARERANRILGEAEVSPTISGCWNTATPATSATFARPAMKTPSWRACAASPTPE
ncbi:luciferase-like monooxygenase family protein [Mycobacterium xenopi 3993]|nr:luciferase-like monooxygenase family protein [Mycobacterium xenopi 3993]